MGEHSRRSALLTAGLATAIALAWHEPAEGIPLVLHDVQQGTALLEVGGVDPPFVTEFDEDQVLDPLDSDFLAAVEVLLEDELFFAQAGAGSEVDTSNAAELTIQSEALVDLRPSEIEPDSSGVARVNQQTVIFAMPTENVRLGTSKQPTGHCGGRVMRYCVPRTGR